MLGRDEPKDVFDIAVIQLETDPDWSLILKAAYMKNAFSLDQLVYRLQTFPHNLFALLTVDDPGHLQSAQDCIPRIIDNLQQAAVR